MPFPSFSFRSSRDPEDSLGRIDRALDDRNHRLMAGLSVSGRFDQVQGALIVTQGNGKYVRIRHVVESIATIPDSVSQGIRDLLNREVRDVSQLVQVQSDLAEVQADVVEQLKCSAGKYVDRVLAVAVQDPGVWGQDFDGRPNYESMCDAVGLAELCGVSVIDAFPARDLAVGGSGRSIGALPIWMIGADRSQPIAKQSRGLISIGEQTRCYWLPASDGRDAELPDIQMVTLPGSTFFDSLEGETSDFSPGGLGCQFGGGTVEDLKGIWHEIYSPEVTAGSVGCIAFEKSDALEQRLIQESSRFLAENKLAKLQVTLAAIDWVVDNSIESIGEPRFAKLDQLMVSCDPRIESHVIDRLSKRLPNVEVVAAGRTGAAHDQIDAVVAAILGLLYIDQMPANVPWVTGAEGQRILGRLTPGRPANWRQLVRVMADFHPAPMKLKDAV